MTVETRTTVRLGDIKAIEYECAECSAKTVRLLDDKHAIPVSCGNCHRPWFADGSQEKKDMELLVNVLRNFPKSSINSHVAIKLEIPGVIPTSKS